MDVNWLHEYNIWADLAQYAKMLTEEQIRRVFGDNSGIILLIFSMKTYVRLAKAILMSTHNIGFYGELRKIILELSSDTLLICSSAV